MSSFPHLRELLKEDAQDLLSGVATVFDDLIASLKRWKKDPVSEKSKHEKAASNLSPAERAAVAGAFQMYFNQVVENIDGATPPIGTALKMASVSKETRNLFISAVGGANAAIDNIATAFFVEAERRGIIDSSERQQLQNAVENNTTFKPSKLGKDFVSHNKTFLRDQVFSINKDTVLMDNVAARELLTGRLANTKPDQQKAAVTASFQVLLHLRNHFTNAERMLSAELRKNRPGAQSTKPTTPTTP